MCGFIGFTTFHQNSNGQIIHELLKKIEHRGPDSRGEYIDSDIVLGFQRLAIVDLSESGNQPLTSKDAMITLVFNGEIYNHNDLRKELQKRGHEFISQSDTEVILHGYEEYGENIFSKLRGMFTIALWDKHNEQCYLVRDPFGIKPLYYHVDEHRDLIFGSEIKGIIGHPNYKAKINTDSLKSYLMFQTSSLNETFFEGINHLKPGHMIKINKMGHTISAYFEIAFNEDKNKTEQEYVDALEAIMKDSVDAHKHADVEVGMFLSGGIDSAYVTSLLIPDKTFSIGFKHENPTFDETSLAKELSDELGIKNYHRIIDADDFFEALPKVIYHMDEPHGNLSAVPLYLLSEMAKEHVTVVLSGEGSDELFAGYDWYKTSKYAKCYKKLPNFMQKTFLKYSDYYPQRLSTFVVNASKSIEKDFIGQAKIFEKNEIDNIIQPSYKSGADAYDVVKQTYNKVSKKDDLTKMQYVDMHHWLVHDILQKADKMTMAHSLELRVPFLDKEVFNVAKTIPSRYRIKDNTTKQILRKASVNALPDEWSKRKKLGFMVPFKDWMMEEKYYTMVKSVFLKDVTKEFFDQEAILSLLDNHFQGKENNARKIYTIYVFLMWHEIYFEKNE